MAKQMERGDVHPWEKIHAIPPVKELVGNGATLSTSLRITRFSPVGGRVKKTAVDWICEGEQLPKQVSLPCSIFFRMKLKSRMMVNHSGGVMENATLALHPHFGTPVVPGSALKGLAGHAAWCEWMGAHDGEKDILASLIAEIFGCPTGVETLDEALKKTTEPHSGSIAFFPANCVGKARLETDLINSHTDGSRSPVPVFFPVVATGILFEFRLQPLCRKTETDMDILMDFATGWLKQGLKEHGAGAKTNAGYGWFEEVD